jgi:hypothetical protein
VGGKSNGVVRFESFVSKKEEEEKKKPSALDSRPLDASFLFLSFLSSSDVKIRNR